MRPKPTACILSSAKDVARRTQPTLMQELAHALSRAERGVTRQLARAMEEQGCTVEDWRTLLLLADGRGHPMTEIAEFALVPAPSVTRLIDRMVTSGLVHRTADPGDRRRVLVHLTRRGRALQRRLDEIVEREQHALLAGAERAEAERLLGLLGGLADRLA
jgi:DNA-binding MarR family transcriptional regulator